jgi:cation-transporting ATPase E
MQIPADCELIPALRGGSGELEVNESLITGESDEVFKKPGDTLLSGSFVISGQATAKVCRVGEDCYAFSLMKGAKYLKKPVSRILFSLNKILKALTLIILPVSVLLFRSDTINNTVAAVLGMLPQGLILLTGLVMTLSVIRLSRHNILAQDMYCAETLARVDVLCLDKTGTITTGEMSVEQIIVQNNADLAEVEDALCALMLTLPDKNPTARAIRAAYSKPTDWEAISTTSFSSARKYSGAEFAGRGTYTLGAAKDAVDGKRTLMLAKNHAPIALIVLNDQIRPDVRATLNFFESQGVEIKVISGDNPETVRQAALAAGVKNAHNAIDMSSFNGDITEIAQKCTIFGRVTPHMKSELIKALKKTSTVGMVGDGVNDILPLKEADCSVAMRSGSDAARNVSSLVLLGDDFSALPKAVAEGRRSINNLERSAVLFLTKTAYSLILAVIFVFLNAPYPFLPIQMTLINGLFIGVPSFLLALEKNCNVVQGSFLTNVLKHALPYGACAALAVVLLPFSAAVNLSIASFAVLCRVCFLRRNKNHDTRKSPHLH